jgi:fermentation-respiration switch protein FrsA (DUF1100 family)
MRKVVVILGVAATLYALWALLLFSQQRRMMFVAWGAPPQGSTAPPAGVERTWLETGSARVEAWYLAPRGTGRSGAVIFAHGNGETIDAWPGELEPFRTLGLAVLLVEYPGYGRSAGEPSETSVRDSFVAAYDWLRARPEIDGGRVVGFGRSLGAGAICRLSRERPLAALVLLSAFPSARIFAARYALPGFLVRDPFDNVAALRAFHGPVLLIHGRDDAVVPFAGTRALLAASPRARLVAYDCGHECWDPGRFPLWQELETFLREAGITRSAIDDQGGSAAASARAPRLPARAPSAGG